MQTISTSAFLRQLRASEPRGIAVPFMVSMDWTTGCNLRCGHCFVRVPGAGSGELGTPQVKHVLANLADHGVLFLVITGGEPLSRPDFRELYAEVKALGFVPTIFSNGTLVTPDLAAFLADQPPRRFEITIYGHTEQTYEAVTGVPGSFRRFRNGVEALLSRGILLRFKTMVMKPNQHEFQQMKEWAEKLDCEFRYDAIVHGRLNGDLAPAEWRIPAEEVARLHFSRAADREDFLHYQQKLGPNLPPKELLFECGAGTMTLHVDTRGHAHPCMLWRQDPYDLLSRRLDRNWIRHIEAVRQRVAPEGRCRTCADRSFCNYCPPIAQIETSTVAEPSAYFCELAIQRKRRLGHAPAPPDHGDLGKDQGWTDGRECAEIPDRRS